MTQLSPRRRHQRDRRPLLTFERYDQALFFLPAYWRCWLFWRLPTNVRRVMWDDVVQRATWERAR